MTDVYVVRNQLDHYWGKAKVWVDGTEPRAVLRAKHEDEAVNTLFELSSRDIDLRGRIESVALTEKGEPDIEPSANLIPKEEKAPELPIEPAEPTEPTQPESAETP